ncbi:echinoderm microtubule-associated protein-like 2 isoform X3 [Periplaneta americana]|uniref:echinoderm microtubule-associated protein-like 2 isoform X3 n=1 Tax=Periplaneta americana TaxID=6978 RepID=UPI0037E7F80D
MRLNGRHGTNRSVATGKPNQPNSSSEIDDMMETENESLRDRVVDLEKKVLEQGDEIVCLRSTLADVLRRLNQFESRGAPSPAPTCLRNGNGTTIRGISHSNHIGTGKDSTPGNVPRLRQPAYHQQPVPTDAGPKDNLRRAASYAPSSLPQRRVVHYQSTGSLHSDSPSSTSVSPVPTSPSPTHTPPPPPGGRTTPSPRTPQPPSQRPNSVGSGSGSGSLHKRWSSTGDFNNSGITSPTGTLISASSMAIASRLATKSLFNLYMRPQPHQQHLLKHGTRDATYNEEEGSVRFFLRGRPVVLHAPTAVAENYDLMKVATAPQTRLKLEWVYGYRGRDCRSNLHLLPTGEMVYFVAAAVVLYNVEEQSQRHYLGHTDDVKCLAIHPNKLLVATGQTAGHDRREGRSWKFNPPPDRMAPEAEQWPHVRVWNSVSLHTMAVIGIGEFERSICCLSFSKADGGVLLCAVDEAPDHNISVWDWQRGEHGQKITETKCSADTVVAAEFHPMDRQSIVTCGKSHISFWTLDAGGTLYKRMGIFENRDKPKYVTCLAFTQTGDVVSGDSNGNIIVWGRGTNTISKFVRGLHEGSVFSICVLKEGSMVTGGGKDGRLVQLDASLSPTGQEARVPDHLGAVRAVAEGRGSQLLVGSTRNCILIGSLELGLTPVVLGHTDELWGLAIHPNLPQFLTAGHDRLVTLWDSMSHSVVWSKDIAEPVQSAAFSPDGSVLIIGCTSGHWMVMDAETREAFSAHTDGGEPIQVVKFSPDGNLLALGSRDNNIYVYQVSEEYRKYSRVGRCTGHSSFITHLDWSMDSQYIQSNSGDYELLYWNAGLCRQIPQSSQLRDVEWASNSCTLSFNTIGIWPEGADGTDVNHCERSHDGNLMATADDFGKVKLYSYPVVQPKSLCHTYGGHSSHVTNVSFLHDDSRLISIGGRDTSVMQWSLS